MADASAVAKAYVVGQPGSEEISKADQASIADPNDLSYVGDYGLQVITPPYDPAFLCKLYEHANSLRPNVDAYRTNIDGFGHVFEPIVELRESGAREVVADAIYIERAQAAQAGQVGALEALMPPTEEEIDARIKTIQAKMRVEKAVLESFFENCVVDESFVSLRRNTREDLEVTGNAYWEVIRNDAGQVAQFVGMPARSVRVTKMKSRSIRLERQIRIGLSFRPETYTRRFRTYVQIGGEAPVYFKEYGDPSIVSGKSGRRFETQEAMVAAEGNEALLANEVIHFKVHSIKNTAYGVPRWIGNLLSVLGSRSAEEVNLAYFDNKSIPPMAILVSGGRLGDESVKRIQDFVEVNIKGKKNFHKILVIEAETSAGAIGLQDNAASMRVEIKQLTDALLKDGLFLEYDAANVDKVGMGFRIPRLLRGDIRDFNRASAQSALDFAESQVFNPERNDFDFLMNRFILSAFGIQMWRFKSLGPRLSDSQDWGDMISKLTTAGILTPQDGRELVGKKVLERELPVVQADWVKQPLALTIAGVQLDNAVDGAIPLPGGGIPQAADPSRLNAFPDDMGTTPPQSLLDATKSRLMRKARELLDLRDAFRTQQANDAVAKFKRERVEEEKLVIKMSPQEMIAKFGITPNA